MRRHKELGLKIRVSHEKKKFGFGVEGGKNVVSGHLVECQVW
jgi:hypothetical protein